MAKTFQTSVNEKTLIKQIMRDNGITIEQLAEKMGKARPTVSNLLIKQNMTIDTLSKFAEALGVEISDLFPVKPGYVHYAERKSRFMGSNPVSSPTANIAANAIAVPQPSQTIQTTAFCPHCGARVKVGVVLMAE